MGDRANQTSSALLEESCTEWISCRGLRLKSWRHTFQRNNQAAYMSQQFAPWSRMCPPRWVLFAAWTSRSWNLECTRQLGFARCKQQGFVRGIVWPHECRKGPPDWFGSGPFSKARNMGLDIASISILLKQSASCRSSCCNSNSHMLLFQCRHSRTELSNLQVKALPWANLPWSLYHNHSELFCL